MIETEKVIRNEQGYEVHKAFAAALMLTLNTLSKAETICEYTALRDLCQARESFLLDLPGVKESLEKDGFISSASGRPTVDPDTKAVVLFFEENKNSLFP